MVNSSYRAKDFTNKFSAVTVLEVLQTLALDFSYIVCNQMYMAEISKVALSLAVVMPFKFFH